MLKMKTCPLIWQRRKRKMIENEDLATDVTKDEKKYENEKMKTLTLMYWWGEE